MSKTNDLRRSKPPIVVAATAGWNRLTDEALNLALGLSPDVIAVHLTKLEGLDIDQEEQSLRQKWSRDVGFRPPRLVVLEAPYRRLHAAARRYQGVPPPSRNSYWS